MYKTASKHRKIVHFSQHINCIELFPKLTRVAGAVIAAQKYLEVLPTVILRKIFK